MEKNTVLHIVEKGYRRFIIVSPNPLLSFYRLYEFRMALNNWFYVSTTYHEAERHALLEMDFLISHF